MGVGNRSKVNSSAIPNIAEDKNSTQFLREICSDLSATWANSKNKVTTRSCPTSKPILKAKS